MKKAAYLILAFASCLLARAEISYIEVRSIQNLPIITLQSLEDAETIVREFNVRIGLLCNKSLYLAANGSYFVFDINGYKSLADYKAGRAARFANGADFYDCKEKSLGASDVYYFYKRNEFASPQDCLDAYKNGFFLGKDSRESESSIYYRAKDFGLSSYAEFKEFEPAMKAGFKTKSDYLDGKEKDFSRGSDYYSARGGKFPNFAEFSAAQKYGLHDYTRYCAFKEFATEVQELEKAQNLKRHEAVACYFIARCLDKGSYAFNVLCAELRKYAASYEAVAAHAVELFANNIDEHKFYEQRNRYYGSYPTLQQILSDANLRNFLSSEKSRKIGKYNENTEVFEKPSARKEDKFATATREAKPQAEKDSRSKGT